jgi:predicted nucleotidyltransferase component of viral defense system
LLVGGTALSLKLGHRKSIDLDLFATKNFQNKVVKAAVGNMFKNFICTSADKAPGVFGYIGDVKIDLVKYHQYKNIRPHEVINGIRLISIEDIAAMKVAVLLDRPRKKDYWDISHLMDTMGVEKIVAAYYEKIDEPYATIVIHRAFLDYDEADMQEDPVSLKGETWKQIKENIRLHINNHLKTDF